MSGAHSIPGDTPTPPVRENEGPANAVGQPWWRRDAEQIGNVARVYGKHTIYIAIAIGCMRAIQALLELAFGRDAKVFGFLPIDWPFAAGDLVMACYFYYFATKEIKSILGGHEDAR